MVDCHLARKLCFMYLMHFSNQGGGEGEVADIPNKKTKNITFLVEVICIFFESKHIGNICDQCVYSGST